MTSTTDSILLTHSYTYLEGYSKRASPVSVTSYEQDVGEQRNKCTQLEWLAQLESKGAKVVQVFHPRTANNQKELTVAR